MNNAGSNWRTRSPSPRAGRTFQPPCGSSTPTWSSRPRPSGTTPRGLAENEKALRRFFVSFPDYDVVLHGHANNDDTLVCWGTARLTMTGNRFGAVPNGERAEIPVFIQFTFKDDLIAGERFFFDLATLCAQSGVSTDAVQQKLFPALAGGDAA